MNNMDSGTARDFIEDLEHTVKDLRLERDEWRKRYETRGETARAYKEAYDKTSDELNNLREDNTRAWQRVAELEAQLKECSAERNRLSQELARTYE